MKLGKIIGLSLAGITIGVVSTVAVGIIFNKDRLTKEDILKDELEKAKENIDENTDELSDTLDSILNKNSSN